MRLWLLPVLAWQGPVVAAASHGPLHAACSCCPGHTRSLPSGDRLHSWELAWCTTPASAWGWAACSHGPASCCTCAQPASTQAHLALCDEGVVQVEQGLVVKVLQALVQESARRGSCCCMTTQVTSRGCDGCRSLTCAPLAPGHMRQDPGQQLVPVSQLLCRQLAPHSPDWPEQELYTALTPCWPGQAKRAAQRTSRACSASRGIQPRRAQILATLVSTGNALWPRHSSRTQATLLLPSPEHQGAFSGALVCRCMQATEAGYTVCALPHRVSRCGTHGTGSCTACMKVS